MTGTAPDPFARRLRLVARYLRWSIAAMLFAFGIGWFGATRTQAGVVRFALVLGTVAFVAATGCFVWLAFQAATRRKRTP